MKNVHSIFQELGRTKYKNARMTVLGSRDQYCINETAKSASGGVTEGCIALISGRSINTLGNIDTSKRSGCNCRFRSGMTEIDPKTGKKTGKFPEKMLYKDFIRDTKLKDTEPWDIEDLMKAGRNNEMCPFFAAKMIKSDVQIVFAPYNYLLDRSIRKSLDINLGGQIVMLDEAHNIEDICRRSASLMSQEGEARNLTEAMAELNNFAGLVYKEGKDKDKAIQVENIGTIKDFVYDVLEFVQQNRVSVEVGKKYSGDQWTLMDFEKLTKEDFEKLWVTPDLFRRVCTAWNEIDTYCRSNKVDIPTRVSGIVGGFLNTFHYMRLRPENPSTYRVLVHKQEYDEQSHRSLVKTSKKSRWPGDETLPDPDFYHELQFVCMSPAVAFRDFERCHSILLASGTLSPLETFEAELGVTFKHKVEANHVIRPEQVFCRNLAFGPDNVPIRAVYSNRDNVKMLVDTGKLIFEAVENLKQGGILVFFTSYATLRNHIFQWKKAKLYNQLKEEGEGQNSFSTKIFLDH